MNLRKVVMQMVIAGIALAASVSVAMAGSYEEEVAGWKTHEDVAKWLQANFQFDKERQKTVIRQLKAVGPENVPTRKAVNLYEHPKGYCRDAASFARDALNRIDPEYNARYIFIKNSHGQPNHWVTGFSVNGKIYVMDYGTGKHWQEMMGVHGPYDALDDYRTFLASLSFSDFAPESVVWRDIRGQED